jgi:pimeloyl-ACP methyl ester carboxylesterase
VSLAKPPQKAKQTGVGTLLLQGALWLIFGLIAIAAVWAAVVRQRIDGAETTNAQVTAPGRFVTVDGFSLHLRDQGALGLPPVLLVHAFNAAGGALWEPVASQLADARVLIPDMIDFGYSPRITEPGRIHSVIGRAELLASLLDQLNTGPVIAAGSGYGGAVAGQLAVLRPDLVATLVLVDPEIYGPSTDITTTLAGLPYVGQAIAFTAWGASGSAQNAFTRGCRADGYCPDEELIAERDRGARVPGTAEALAAMAASAPASTVLERLASISVPTLIVWGENDRITPVDQARTMANTISGARLTFVNAGHQPELENPAAVAEIINQLIAGG